jgi:hypothetical protein
MAASLQQFLGTAQLGPLTLGMKPNDAQVLLGDPDERSRKLNPLVLKYGPLALTFIGPKSEPPRLVQMLLSFDLSAGSLPEPVDTTDWHLSHDTTMREFNLLLELNGIEPTVRPSAHEVVLPSGVRAVFYMDRLKQVGVSHRDTDDNRAPALVDSREASPSSIRNQLAESNAALQSGLVSAALMLAWASLEASMRRAAIHAGLKGRIGVQPSVLIRELYGANQLTSDEVSFLERARQIRTSVAHGVPTVPIEVSLVEAIGHIAERLLRTSEKAHQS